MLCYFLSYGVRVKQVEKQKLLGVFIDENLSWTAHIDNLCSTISSKMCLLKKLSSYVPVEIQKLFYQGYIFPLIDYGSNTWGTTSKHNIERISKLQKRAARNLRSVTCGSLSVPRSKTALYDGSFSATAPKLWNALPSDISTCSSLDNFKKSAKITL